MLEITEKILASISAKPMKRGEVFELPYLKFISEFGIDYSLNLLTRKEFIIEKVINRHPYRTKEYREKYGEVIKVEYRATKKGREYLQEHGYIN